LTHAGTNAGGMATGATAATRVSMMKVCHWYLQCAMGAPCVVSASRNRNVVQARPVGSRDRLHQCVRYGGGQCGCLRSATVFAGGECCQWCGAEDGWLGGVMCSVRRQTGRWLARDPSMVVMGHTSACGTVVANVSAPARPRSVLAPRVVSGVRVGQDG